MKCMSLFTSLFISRRRGKDKSECEPSSCNQSSAVETTAMNDSAVIREGKNLSLTLLHQPPKPADAVVDIVFIHGLTGNAFNTWSHQQNGVHWPSKLLKKDIPEARIFTFGYDADVASFYGGTSKNRLADHAANLVRALASERGDVEHRRIIFVVHSLGGLVTERALQGSETNAEKHLRQIEDAALGIVFLGTPHAGSGFAAFAKALGRSLCLAGKRVNTDILDTLKAGSQTLLDVEEWFGQWLRRRVEKQKPVQITCFFEEFGLPVVGKVVDEWSAKVFGYSAYSIHNNHMDMCKFEGPEDPDYKAVRDEIRRWIKDIPKAQGEDATQDAAR